MKSFENERDFIKWTDSLKRLNLESRMACFDMELEHNYDGKSFEKMAANKNLLEGFVKNAMTAKATDRILRHIFLGVVSSIYPSNMTERQNQVLNAIVGSEFGDYSVVEKQEFIRNGVREKIGLDGCFSPGVFDKSSYHLYQVDRGILDDGPLSKCLFSYEDMEEVEFSVVLPGLLGMDNDRSKTSKTINSFGAGIFPVELSEEGKSVLFGILDDPNKYQAAKNR